jgi:hypothetical protein
VTELDVSVADQQCLFAEAQNGCRVVFRKWQNRSNLGDR